MRYFTTKQSMALSITAVGISLGTFIWPPIARFLIDEYQWHGALLIIAAALLNEIPLAMLIHDPPKKPRASVLTSAIAATEEMAQYSKTESNGDTCICQCNNGEHIKTTEDDRKQTKMKVLGDEHSNNIDDDTHGEPAHLVVGFGERKSNEIGKCNGEATLTQHPNTTEENYCCKLQQLKHQSAEIEPVRRDINVVKANEINHISNDMENIDDSQKKGYVYSHTYIMRY